MKLLIASGGGGHFSPALAVIEKLPKDWSFLVVGRKYPFEGEKTLSLEYQTAKKLGIPFQSLTTGRLQRRFTRHTILSLFKIPYGLTQALFILKRYKPDAVLSFGGYVAVPVCMAAKILSIPIVIHEQTLGAGLATKITAKLADKICISWGKSEKYFPASKTVLTGNPIREFQISNFKLLPAGKAGPTLNDRKMIYVTGGSGGAHAVNTLVEGALEKLLEKYIVIHQTGDAREFGDFERLEKFKEALPKELRERYITMKFVDPSLVFKFLKEADLVISRSGVNTVTELLSFGKPCLLIPLPYGQHNEQLQNALFVQEVGLGEVVDQQSLTSEKLYEKVVEMFTSLGKYKAHAEEAKRLVDVDAAEKIIKVVNSVVRN